MTEQEFIEKMESEGVDYAFTGYGLSEADLDDSVSPEFRKAVVDTRIAYERASHFAERIYALAP
ncbi:MAG TPA: hypothetical protein VN039_04645 [Nitrospira sp.]|nr:hypothetical protein [Nitrospira sp.]